MGNKDKEIKEMIDGIKEAIDNIEDEKTLEKINEVVDMIIKEFPEGLNSQEDIARADALKEKIIKKYRM